MRPLLLTITLLAATFGTAQAAKSKSMPQNVGPGRVAWFDLTTTDLAKSQEFYGQLFGWTFAPVPGTKYAVEIVSKGQGIGTIRVAEGEIGKHHGVVYVQVPAIQPACERAKELGGTLVPGFPFNLSNGTGAIGLVVDPTGHSIGLYSRTPMPEKKAAKP